jgi:hypothetical protein
MDEPVFGSIGSDAGTETGAWAAGAGGGVSRTVQTPIPAIRAHATIALMRATRIPAAHPLAETADGGASSATRVRNRLRAA